MVVHFPAFPLYFIGGPDQVSFVHPAESTKSRTPISSQQPWKRANKRSFTSQTFSRREWSKSAGREVTPTNIHSRAYRTVTNNRSKAPPPAQVRPDTIGKEDTLNSKTITMIIATAASGYLCLVASYAQSINPFNGNVSNQYLNGIPSEAHATVKDPEGKVPGPTHIPIILPKDIQWKVLIPNQGYIANIYGNPNKPGPYAVMYKWLPGAFSKPHFHDQVRHIVVVSGTWWVSSSTTYDEKLTYPLRAGTVATDNKNAIHWDGARSGEKQPAIIYLYGEGPVATVYVDTNGKPIPLAKK
jgi:hypothetical protein